MSEMQGYAAILLWSSKQFNTAEIAELLHVQEAIVEKALHQLREALRGPRLHVVRA